MANLERRVWEFRRRAGRRGAPDQEGSFSQEVRRGGKSGWVIRAFVVSKDSVPFQKSGAVPYKRSWLINSSATEGLDRLLVRRAKWCRAKEGQQMRESEV
jgi:hypothetical protein